MTLTPSDEPEPGYRPSAVPDRWIRLRDLTCRFPGCDQPAVRSDIDHTIPGPPGRPTVEQQGLLPKNITSQDILARLVGPAGSGRPVVHHHAQRADLRLHTDCHPAVPAVEHHHGHPAGATARTPADAGARTEDAQAQADPDTGPARYIATERARNESSDEAPY